METWVRVVTIKLRMGTTTKRNVQLKMGEKAGADTKMETMWRWVQELK